VLCDCRGKLFGINMCCLELPVSDESSAETECNLTVDVRVSTSCQGVSTVPNTSLVRVICLPILTAVLTVVKGNHDENDKFSRLWFN